MDGKQVSDNLLHELADMKRRLDQLWTDVHMSEPYGPPIFQMSVAIVTTQITAGDLAADPKTTGEGVVDRYRKNDDDELVEMVDKDGDAISETVYNWTESVAAVDAAIFMVQDTRDGTWWYISEAC